MSHSTSRGVFATTYERGRYARLIDYAMPPSVLRKPEDRAWAEKRQARATLGSLKSGTIIVPVVLHSLGNSCAVVMHFGTWYWLHG